MATCGTGRKARCTFVGLATSIISPTMASKPRSSPRPKLSTKLPDLVPGHCIHGRVLRQALLTENSRTGSSVPPENVSAVRSTTIVQARTDTRRLKTTGAMRPAAASTGPTNPCANQSAPSSSPCPIRRRTWNALSEPISNLSPRWTLSASCTMPSCRLPLLPSSTF